MIHLKSFWRKRTTQIYITITVLLFLGFIILILGKNYLIKLANEDYSTSYVSFEEKNNVEAILEKNKYIKNIKIGINAFFRNQNIVLMKSEESIKKNEIILPIYYQDYFDGISEIEIETTKGIIIYNINSYSQFEPQVFRINSESFDEIKTENVVFYLELKDWLKHDKTIEEIKKEIDSEARIISYINTKPNKVNYENIIIICNSLIVILIAIFIIIYGVSLNNIFEDERRYKKLYFNLGYNKSNIISIMNQKILSVIILASGTSFIISIFGFFVFKLIIIDISWNDILSTIAVYLISVICVISFCILRHIINYLKKDNYN